ncbi:MAG: hypothetical protein MJK10_22285 [Pseudomonadales bacterium]|nr:hypothetical protein [Pseudomonadales bacterium]NRA14877.1 hypothetical protein [Oceanospirillaceae bacterium]
MITFRRIGAFPGSGWTLCCASIQVEPLTRGGEIALRVNPTEQPIIAANQQRFLMYDVLENKALKVVC